MEKIMEILKSLEKGGKIKIINNMEFIVVKNNCHIIIEKINENIKCECGNKGKYLINEKISENYTMEGQEICQKCLINNLINFEECGWEN